MTETIASLTIKDLKAVIQQEANNTIRGLTVTIVSKIIILGGRTTRYYHKQLAQEAIFQWYPGYDVMNNISVNDSLKDC